MAVTTGDGDTCPPPDGCAVVVGCVDAGIELGPTLAGDVDAPDCGDAEPAGDADAPDCGDAEPAGDTEAPGDADAPGLPLPLGTTLGLGLFDAPGFVVAAFAGAVDGLLGWQAPIASNPAKKPALIKALCIIS